MLYIFCLQIYHFYDLDWGSHLNLIIRLLLTFVLLASSIGKLRDPGGTEQALVDFGLPSRLVNRGAFLLPRFELLLAVCLLIDPISKQAGVLALLFFFGLTAATYRLIKEDRAPPCHCFGALSSEPVSQGTLLRALACLLGAILTLATQTYPIWSVPLLASATIAGIALSAIALNLHLRKNSLAELEKPTSRLSAGQRLPAIRVDGGSWLEHAIAKNKRTLVIATSSDCLSCRRLHQDFSSWSLSLAEDLPILCIEPRASENHRQCLTTDLGDFKKLMVTTPSAILVDRNAVLLSPPIAGEDGIKALIRAALARDSDTTT